MILVYLNVVRMGEIPSGSSTKLNPRSTAVAPAVAFVRVALYELGASTFVSHLCIVGERVGAHDVALPHSFKDLTKERLQRLLHPDTVSVASSRTCRPGHGHNSWHSPPTNSPTQLGT